MGGFRRGVDPPRPLDPDLEVQLLREVGELVADERSLSVYDLHLGAHPAPGPLGLPRTGKCGRDVDAGPAQPLQLRHGSRRDTDRDVFPGEGGLISDSAVHRHPGRSTGAQWGSVIHHGAVAALAPRCDHDLQRATELPDGLHLHRDHVADRHRGTDTGPRQTGGQPRHDRHTHLALRHHPGDPGPVVRPDVREQEIAGEAVGRPRQTVGGVDPRRAVVQGGSRRSPRGWASCPVGRTVRPPGR